jgi:hypothetical protein
MVKVTNLKIKGLYLYDSCAWNLTIHGCTNGLIEFNRIFSRNTNANRDGISLIYGCQNITVRFCNIYNYDDILPILNWNNNPGDWTAAYQNGTRDTKNINIYSLFSFPNTSDSYIGKLNVIDILSMDSQVISNIHISDIKHDPKRLDVTGVILSIQGYGNGINKLRIKNIYGGIDRVVDNNPIIFIGTYPYKDPEALFSASDILINNLNVLAVPSAANGYKYVFQANTNGGTIDQLAINSKIYQAPTTAILDISGATLTNFTHTEEIDY